MNLEKIVGILVVYTLVRELFFYLQIHRLLNKLMSRNYHEFQVSQKTGKMEKPRFQPVPFDDAAEDLNRIAP